MWRLKEEIISASPSLNFQINVKGELPSTYESTNLV